VYAEALRARGTRKSRYEDSLHSRDVLERKWNITMIAEAAHPVKTTPYCYLTAAQQPGARLLSRRQVAIRGQAGSDDDEHEFGGLVVRVGQLVRNVTGSLGAVTGVQGRAAVDGDDLDAALEDEEALT